MRSCGKLCISNNAIKIARQLYSRCNSIEEFLEKLNEADIGGRYLHIENERIIGIYKKCYCSIPKKVTTMNKIYCECSAGWFETLFSEVLGKEVNVKILNTIINGATECVFEIEYL